MESYASVEKVYGKAGRKKERVIMQERQIEGKLHSILWNIWGRYTNSLQSNMVKDTFFAFIPVLLICKCKT